MYCLYNYINWIYLVYAINVSYNHNNVIWRQYTINKCTQLNKLHPNISTMTIVSLLKYLDAIYLIDVVCYYVVLLLTLQLRQVCCVS